MPLLHGKHTSFQEEIAAKSKNIISFDLGSITEEIVLKLSFLGIVLLGTLKHFPPFSPTHAYGGSCVFSY